MLRIVFIINVLVLFIITYFSNITIITMGGLFLMQAAIYLYFGKIFYSSLIYVIADLAWAINAYQREDMFGFISVIFGLLMGLGVMYKMKHGIFVMDLNTRRAIDER